MHAVSYLPGECQDLLGGQVRRWFYLGIFVVTVVPPTTSPKVTEKISVRYILNDYIWVFYRMIKTAFQIYIAKHIQRLRLSEENEDFFFFTMFDL